MRHVAQICLFTLFLSVSGATLDPIFQPGSQVRSLALAAPKTCRPAALSQLKRHKIAAGETLDSIARRYNLIPATLMGFNPVLQTGKAPVGEVIVIPPYNGIRVALSQGQTLRTVAKAYNIRPDVLFEINGCQPNPRVVFVPGVNWSPIAGASSAATGGTAVEQIVSAFPLPKALAKTEVLLGYGWKLQPATGEVAFHSGIDLAAPVGTSVLASGSGTVAFASNQGVYGNLVVINHAQGLQTRYAQLGSIRVKVGQTVKRGQVLGTVGTTGTPSSRQPHLHFEVRSRSELGWVAENSETYLKKILAQ